MDDRTNEYKKGYTYRDENTTDKNTTDTNTTDGLKTQRMDER
jgi:hypothetical protein